MSLKCGIISMYQYAWLKIQHFKVHNKNILKNNVYNAMVLVQSQDCTVITDV
jgi:hypothetical protein